MQPITIDSIIDEISLFKHNWKFNLLKVWPSIIGQLTEHVIVEKIGDDHITLGVSNSCWMQELYSLTPLIQKRINEHLENQKIKKIYLKNKHISKKNNINQPFFFQPQSPSPITKPLTIKEKKALESIKDTELQKAVENFRTRCLWNNE